MATKSLNEVFDPRANSLNALRLVFATTVLVSHSFAIGGLGPEPRIGGVTIASLAVDGFFVISGYLITMSRLRSRSLGSYARRRFLRIYPGLWVNLLVTVALIVPLLLWLEDDHTTLGNVARYMQNVILPRADRVDWISSRGPLSGIINGSLWTLQWEIAGYVALGVLGSIGLLGRRAAILSAMAAFTVLAAVEGAADVPALNGWYATNGIRFGLLFLAGASIFLLREKLSARAPIAAAAAVTLILSLLVLPDYRVVGAVPLAYLCIWLGARLPLSRLGASRRRRQPDDLSYGVYVYAFPLQQVVWALLGTGANPLLFIGLSLLFTFPVAFLSWRLIEAPAMAWGLKLGRRDLARSGGEEAQRLERVHDVGDGVGRGAGVAGELAVDGDGR